MLVRRARRGYFELQAARETSSFDQLLKLTSGRAAQPQPAGQIPRICTKR
jgi:hypothetical protein